MKCETCLDNTYLDVLMESPLVSKVVDENRKRRREVGR